jgi:amino acid permease
MLTTVSLKPKSFSTMITTDREEAAPLLQVESSPGDKEDTAVDEVQLVALPKAHNSWWAAGIQCLNSMIGSGILAMPYTFSKVGWVLFTLEIVFFATVVFASSAMLLEVGQRKGLLNFSAVTEHVFGARTAGMLTFAIVASTNGALMSYLNVIGSLGASVVQRWGYSESFLTSYSGFVLFIATLIVPLILFRSYGELTPISLMSLFFIVVIVFFILAEGLWLNDGVLYTAQAWPQYSTAPIVTLGTFAFSGSIQPVIFEAYLSTREDDKPKFISASLALAVGFGFLLMFLMAAFGYGAFSSDCESDIMSNFSSGLVVVQLAQLVVVLHLTLYIPNAFIIMRLFACELVGCNPLTLAWPSFVGITLALWAFPVLVMVWIPEADVEGVFAYIIDLTGDLPIGFSAYALPAALYIKVVGLPTESGTSKYMFYFSHGIFVLGLVLMITCPVVDTYYFLKSCITETCSSY